MSGQSETQPVVCDCLNFCGDDPWLANGKAKPCDHSVRRTQEQKEAEKLSRVMQAGPKLLSALQSLYAAMACHDNTPEEFLALASARTAIDKATGVTT